MHLILKTCELRSWRTGDLDSMVAHANNRNVWINLRDRFPHPYTVRDGRAFLKHTLAQQPETAFAIAVNGEAVGGIGFQIMSDVERVSAEIGYWLGEPFWGQGIATEALVALTRYAIATHGLTRDFRRTLRVERGFVSSARKSGLRAGGSAAAKCGQGRQGDRSAAVRVQSLTFSSELRWSTRRNAGTDRRLPRR